MLLGLIVIEGYSQSATIEPNYFTLPKSATIPTSCLTTEKGKMIYNTTDNRIYYCTGTIYENMIKINDFGGTVTQPFEVINPNGTSVKITSGTAQININAKTQSLIDDDLPPALWVQWNVDKNSAIKGTSFGIAVKGYTYGNDNNSKGVAGYTNETEPTDHNIGVYGRNTSTNQFGYGVFGKHDGLGIGVNGESHHGIGVRGKTNGAGNNSAGVTGEAMALYTNPITTNNSGVHGVNWNPFTNGYGVFGEHLGEGVGVYGLNSFGGVGVKGEGSTGVFGLGVKHGNNNGVGVLGDSDEGTAIRATTRTGFGLDVTAVQSGGNAANFFSLDNYSIISTGKLKFAGTTLGQGVGKILTCIDAFGNAEWREPPTSSGGGSSAGFSAIGVASGAANAQNIPANTSTKVAVFTVEEFDDANQFSGNTFTASTAGLYHFDLKMNLFATTPPASSVYTIQVRKNGANVRVTTQTAPTDAIDYNTSFNLKLVANDIIEIYVNAPMAFKIYASTFSNFSGYKVY